MRLITIRSQILDVALRYDSQYPPGKREQRWEEISRRLWLLDKETATEEDVAKITGNNSWVRLATCDECLSDVTAAVQVGEEPDYESNTATICLTCLKAAVRMMEPEP